MNHIRPLLDLTREAPSITGSMPLGYVVVVQDHLSCRVTPSPPVESGPLGPHPTSSGRRSQVLLDLARNNLPCDALLN